MKQTKICTIGGGSGMPIVNQALLLADFSQISSIVTTFDSGGDTGRMRTDERGGILAFSDYWRALLSLWPKGKQKRRWEEMLKYRDGRDRSFGNLFFAFMAEREKDLGKVDNLFSQLTGAKICGKVIPISRHPADICFKTQSGKIYKGEHLLDAMRMSRDLVRKVWLEPPVEANSEALEAIRNAEVIIICPGSMYGSILANFLPRGVKEAYRRSRAKKILLTNIMSVANENHKFSQDDYVRVFTNFLKTKSPFDLIIMPDFQKLDQKILRKVLKLYELENSFPIKPNLKSNNKALIADIATIEEKNYRLRHDPQKLAKIFTQIISEP
ncbi:YvcK family protein [Candidatus Shapirobacteria bacterium]|nr:YvcK family protein [Candidatus Shapirobacteria bacterium]